ncbi:MAG: hypothetical protein JXR46_09715 [Calditrichaceae bacterium]|nr:hypothetical protein [Calditrichaceae bacterium]MBN2709310.1 hypothetical protein [Calditrichaceae bacterium]RQV91993.1 MAG: hypothetical protein EH224_16655 [Calditrichota bacterium]
MYPHPLLQEGLAVALGGRGGLMPATLLSIGRYLERSNMLKVEELFKRSSFRDYDPSLTYPLAAAFVDYFIKKSGFQNYVNLYKNHSASKPEDVPEISITDLPFNLSEWILFLRSNIDDVIQLPDREYVMQTDIISRYSCRMKDTLLITVETSLNNMTSGIFSRFFSKRKYAGEKYLLIAEEGEISVYNLYSDMLIAKYAAVFSENKTFVSYIKGCFLFMIRNDVFDEEIEPLNFIEGSCLQEN